MSEVRVSKLKGIGASLNQVSIPPGNDLRIGTEGCIDMRSTGALQLPTGNTSQRPASPQAGYMRFNSETTRLEIYGGSDWILLGGPLFNLYDASEFSSFISYMQARKTGWASSGTNFQYATDASDTYIGDAQSDMYDSGNYTQVRVNGNQSGNIGYNSGSSTYNNVRYKPLGYSWPLVAIAVAPTDASTTYGWSRSGNLGADGGGGSPNSVTVYNGDVVSGWTVHAWLVNKGWNQNSDPSVCHLYCTVGQTAWSSSVSNGFTTTDYAGNSDSDYSYYQSTSTNCFVWTALVSKGQTNGDISQAQARSFVDNFLASARTHFG